MRTWGIAGVAAVAALVAGCDGPAESKGSVEPMPTDGPNQVVIRVPGMH